KRDASWKRVDWRERCERGERDYSRAEIIEAAYRAVPRGAGLPSTRCLLAKRARYIVALHWLPKFMPTIDRKRLAELHAKEEKRFIAEHPRSAELYGRAKDSLLGGVPMNWMKKWAGAFPIFVAHAKGAHFTDVDGH